jgi:hypothetical protein
MMPQRREPHHDRRTSERRGSKKPHFNPVSSLKHRLVADYAIFLMRQLKI